MGEQSDSDEHHNLGHVDGLDLVLKVPWIGFDDHERNALSLEIAICRKEREPSLWL